MSKKIEYNILEDGEMKNAGFIDIGEDWMLEEFWSDIELLLLVLLPKNRNDSAIIEVVDEETRNKYDYQYILSQNADFKVARMAKERVDKTVSRLVDVGVIL